MDTPTLPSVVRFRRVALIRHSPDDDWGFVMRGRHELFPGVDRPPVHSATIHEIDEGSPAHKAGLESDDQILAVNERNVREMEHADVLDQFRGKTYVQLELIRKDDREKERVQIVPGFDRSLQFLWALAHHLQTLCLWKLKLGVLKVDLRNLTSLNELYVNHCSLKSLDPIQGLLLVTSLRTLSLDYNSLSGDSLGEESEVAKLGHLTTLNLGSNKLTSVPLCVFKLTRLVCLSLARNKIEVVPSTISKLKHLKQLFIDENKLTCLEPEILHLPHLDVLGIANNKMEREPGGLAASSLMLLRNEGNPYVVQLGQRKQLQRRVTAHVKQPGKPAIVEQMHT